MPYHYGNLSRFVNHSCVPIVLVANVFIDECDRSEPILALFAARQITAGEEITISCSGNFMSEEEQEAAIAINEKRKKAEAKIRRSKNLSPQPPDVATAR